MTGVSIVCAYTDLGDEDRRRSFEFTRRQWKAYFPDAELVVAAPEPFTRARGLNAAVEMAQHDLIVQADPDTVAPPNQIRLALTLAADHDHLVVPYSQYLYLNEAATRRLQAGTIFHPPAFTVKDCQDHGSGGHGPITVFSRSTWEKAGGYDERFGLWGGDDSAFAYACEAFCGPDERVLGLCYHSYHERLPQSVPGGPGYAEQFALLAQYRDAAASSRDHVRQLVRTRQ